MALENKWYLRRVAEALSKACFVCFKPSTSVLITPDNKDYFYICPGHLADKGFCSPIIDQEAEAAKAAKKRREELEKEIEKVKKEYEEKQKRKKEKKKAKEDSKDKGKGKDEDKKADEDEDKELSKERDDKIKTLRGDEAKEPTDEDMPRVYVLHKQIYQMRLDRIRNMEVAKKNRERLRDPSTFPAVPKGDI